MLLWTPPLTCVMAMAGAVFLHNVGKMGAIIHAEKHVPLTESTNSIISVFLWFYLFPFSNCLVFFFFFHSREEAIPMWLTSSLWSDRNQTTGWAPQQAEVPAPLKGASDAILKKGVFSRLPSTINTNHQDDLDFCCPVPDGSVLILWSSLQVCALWLWQDFILK